MDQVEAGRPVTAGPGSCCAYVACSEHSVNTARNSHNTPTNSVTERNSRAAAIRERTYAGTGHVHTCSKEHYWLELSA